MARLVIDRVNKMGLAWVFYSHRKLLFSQTYRKLKACGIAFGIRASGYYWNRQTLAEPGQLAMIASEHSAIKQHAKRPIHDAQVVIVDEAHANKAGWSEELIREHQKAGATVIGLTATPVGIGHLYDSLVVAGTNSELRKCGALVKADHYAPSELDLRHVKRVNVGEFSQAQLAKVVRLQQVFGQVYDHWKTLNPDARLALLFAPGVKESQWFVDEFERMGVRAAHIDGVNVYVDGQEYKTSQAARDDVIDRAKDGEIKLLCNRFVMREGIDIPEVYHGIFATAFGTEEGWVQAGGRIIRAHESLDRVIIQDHGGNCKRPSLGSLNQNRVWSLDDTNQSRFREANKDRQNGKQEESVTCQSCKTEIAHQVWAAKGFQCPKCGHHFKRSKRIVIQIDGKLKPTFGATIKKKRQVSDAQKAWNNLYFPSAKSKSPRSSTFAQLRARFERANPQYRIVYTKDGQTAAKARDGSVTVLSYAPPAHSSTWDLPVRRVPSDQLQRV